MPKYDLIKHLEFTNSGRPCPYCGGMSWNIYGPLAMLKPNDKGAFHIPGHAQPLAGIECNKCGDLRLIRFEFLEKIPGIKSDE